ncbi:MAG: aldo/keto reductase, partial [Pseudomonadota bacterium]
MPPALEAVRVRALALAGERALTATEAIAKKKNTQITSVALAYVMHKAPHVFPIVGGRTVGHLKEKMLAGIGAKQIGQTADVD